MSHFHISTEKEPEPNLRSLTAAFPPRAVTGNYMVRNTEFSRDFLMRWAKYYDQRPSGFSSSDNGAIQLVAPGQKQQHSRW